MYDQMMCLAQTLKLTESCVRAEAGRLPVESRASLLGVQPMRQVTPVILHGVVTSNHCGAAVTNKTHLVKRGVSGGLQIGIPRS